MKKVPPQSVSKYDFDSMKVGDYKVITDLTENGLKKHLSRARKRCGKKYTMQKRGSLWTVQCVE